MKKNALFLAFFSLAVSACGGPSYTELQLAAARGQADRVETIVKRGADIDEPNKHGRTAMMLAADRGHTAAVETLLRHNAFKDAKDIDGMTALMLAAAEGHTDTINVLLKFGADRNIKNNYDATALTNSVFFGHLEATRALLNGEPKFSRDTAENALLVAAGLGHVEIMKLLLDYGVDVNAIGKSRRTPLMAAINFGQPNSVEFLLSKGANIDHRDADGVSPQDLAKDKGVPEIIALLEKYSGKRAK